MPKGEVMPWESIPVNVRMAWERMRERLGKHGLVHLIHPQKSRVSLKSGQQRYLKYDYEDQRWVFCQAVGERMDQLDPNRLCPRGSSGTRLENACASYGGANLVPLFPVLDRLVDLVVSDLGR